MKKFAFVNEVKFTQENLNSYLPINISDGYSTLDSHIVSVEEEDGQSTVNLEQSKIQYFDKVQLQTVHRYKKYGHWSIFSGLDA
jgi:hypothetical protein